MSEPFIRYDDVHKSFGSNAVLRGVSLDVPTGKTVVILGGSGSGKSVLIKHTIGLLQPDSGAVIVDGVDITCLPEDQLIDPRKKVGMLFQNSALFDSMTVRENVAFALEEHTDWVQERILDRVHDVLGFVDLHDIDDQLPSDLSGGMRKRVALARAIALAPQALLYDEPTTGLDPITANSITRLIRSLQERLGMTSIVVTHDLHATFTVGDRIAFLYEGRILWQGTVDEARKSDEPRLRNFLEGGGYG